MNQQREFGLDDGGIRENSGPVECLGMTFEDPSEPYHCEPFAADSSGGKNDSIYNAHAYHTKSPWTVVAQYTKHFTEPGNIILDVFAGSGMTGAAVASVGGGRAAVLVELSPCAKAKDRWYVPDPRRAGDLEKLRDRALHKEFDEYRDAKQKRLKVFRLEAVRAGFKRAWQERDYATIIAVARKIPESVLQEDPKLLMWFDQALTRSGEDA